MSLWTIRPDGRRRSSNILHYQTGSGEVGISRICYVKGQNAIFTHDKKGAIRNAWGLAPESSAVIILNKAGKVVFFKDGQLSKAEIDQVIQVIKKNL